MAKREEIEKVVIDNGSPEVLIVDPEDWQLVYDAYKATNRDEQGTFVLVINTRVYSSVPAAAEVDLSGSKIWAGKGA